MKLPLSEAEEVVEAVLLAGQEIGKALSVAVVDAGGYLLVAKRSDGARAMTPSIAIAKAYSAAIMERPSLMLRKWADSNPVFFNQVAQMGHQPIIPTEGGVPVKRDGEILGGLGIAGGTAGEDQQLCDDVLSSLGYQLEFAAWGVPGKPDSTTQTSEASHG